MIAIPVDVRKRMIDFGTPEEAIEACRNNPLSERVRSDSERLSGTTIEDGYWTEKDFAIKFSNGLWIHVYVETDTVKWVITDRRPALGSLGFEEIGADPVLLLWEGTGESSVLDRSSLLAQRIGKEFSDLFLNDIGLYLYTKKQRILTFNAIFRRDTGGEMLLVDEDD